jgi:TRAP-type C4-dicarboxylate transport system permease small subunit
MKQFAGLVTGFSRLLDRIAGFCMVAIMLLVVANIVMRAVFNHPILGAYEHVGFLTAAMIAFALAHCALQDGHIAVGFVVDRFPARVQSMVDTILNIIALGFWSLSAWFVLQYANSMKTSGVVSPSAQVPVYPFVYLVAFGLAALCLVFAVRLVESAKKVAAGVTLKKGYPVAGTGVESIKKAAVSK